MKRILFIFLFACSWISVLSQAGKPASQPGRYAGTKKSLVGKTFQDSRNIPGLSGWQYLGGSLLSPLDDPEWFLVDVFKKGTTQIIIFTVKEDTAAEEYKILDLVEVKNVLSTQEIKTGLCRENKTEDVMIVALIRPRNMPYNKAIKAWKLNRDKRRAEIMPAAKVDCLHEGY